MEEKDQHEKIAVFYDGECPMCTVIMEEIDHSSQKEVFDLRNMHTDRQLPFDKAAVEKEIHVIDTGGHIYKGSAAILKIMDQYPRLKTLSRFARLPFIKPFLPLGYALVSKNRRFLFGPASRIFWMKMTLTLASIFGLAMSVHLWIGPRVYPLVPLWSGLPALAHPFDQILFGLLFLFAGAALFSSRPRKFILSFVAVLALFCLFDQGRWQPWIFQYIFLFMTLALFSWKSKDVDGRWRTLNILRLIVASTYIFSGLQKVNLFFIGSVFPWFVSPITEVIPFIALPLYCAGVLAPFIEVAFGIGLLTQKYRKISVTCAIAMHLFIITMIGPFGLEWNVIVWPWTLAMVLFDLLLFTGVEDFSWRGVVFPKGAYHSIVLLFFVVMPCFSFFNVWDSYLSAALYSGNTTEGKVYFDARTFSSAPPVVRPYLKRMGDEEVLTIQDWSFAEMNVPPYPETRVFKSVVKALCAVMDDPTQLSATIREKRLFNNTIQTNYQCANLK